MAPQYNAAMPSRALPVVWSIVVLSLAVSGSPGAQTSLPARVAPYADTSARLIAAAQANDFAWRRLAELTDTYGNRLSGSENLNRAIQWAITTLKADGLANVHTERVMVPRWVRGQESAVIVDPPEHPVAILGLGGSVATPPDGLEADVLVVTSFQDLDAKASSGAGQDRALQRAVYHLRRDGAVPHRAGQWRRPGTAPWPRSCGRSARWGCARRTPAT